MHSSAAPTPRFLELIGRSRALGALAIALAAVEVLLDVTTWIELNIAIIYSLPLVLAAASRNRRLLWGLTIVLVAVTFAVYWEQIARGAFALDEEYFINRLLTAVSLVVAAGLLHALSVAVEVLEARNRQLFAYQQEIERRNRELDLQRAEAEEASDRKTRLLMSVSHDVRSPLTTITLMAELIRASAGRPERADQLPGLAQSLEKNALSLAELVNDVLDIAYFDSGRIELRETDFALDAILAEECRALEPLAEAKGLGLKAQPSRPAVWLRADRIKLARVLRNLITNAVGYTERGGVTIAAALTAEGGVAIRVSDTGRGIAPENLERVFGEFTQLARPAGAERAGWGLGLAICRRLTRLMGGDVSVESELHRGSVFTVHLPPSRVLRGPPQSS